MIDVQNVRKEFDGFAALGGATLTVPNGAVYGLVGPNGAGKSTLIRHITGIYRQDVGEITSRRGGGFRESFRQSAHRFDSGRLVLFSPVRCAGYDAFLPGILSEVQYGTL